MRLAGSLDRKNHLGLQGENHSAGGCVPASMDKDSKIMSADSRHEANQQLSGTAPGSASWGWARGAGRHIEHIFLAPAAPLGGDGSDVTMAGLLGSIRRSWRFIVAVTILFGLGSIVVTLRQPKVYSASMRITAPLDQPSQSSSGGGGLLSALTGSAQQSSRNFTQLLNLLHSNRVAKLLMQDPAFVSHIYGSGWVLKNGAWMTDRPMGLKESLKARFLSIFDILVTHGPTVPKTYDFLVGSVTKIGVSDTSSLFGGGGSNIITVSARDNTPENARALLIKTVNAADAILKKSEKQNFAQRIAYLSKRLEIVSITDYRASLLASLSDQERSAMFIGDTGYYSLFVLDDPVLNTVPISPKPTLNFIMAVLLGFVMSLLFVLFRDGMAGRSKQ